MTRDRDLFPDAKRAEQIQKELVMMRAVEAYRTFYPAVSAYSAIKDSQAIGSVPNQKHIVFRYASPRTNALTANSDTCYGILVLDLHEGPVVVEVPAGGFIGVCNSLYFNEIGNFGVPGPDKGQGGTYTILPPGYEGEIPDGYYVFHSETYLLTCAMRVTELDGDQQKAMDTMLKIRTYPLGRKDAPPKTEFIDLTEKEVSLTSTTREETLEYWQMIHEILQDVPLPVYYTEYGRLATLGIKRGKPFNPSPEMQELLLEAAQTGIEQMTVEAFSSHTSECLAWPDRRWEWVGVIGGTGYYTDQYRDPFASDRWFFQATLSTKMMFPRKAAPGSEYLLGILDKAGNYLDGGKSYRLLVPAAVPAKVFWSVTVYDAKRRSEIVTDTNKAAISSLHTKVPVNANGMMELYFGPEAPEGKDDYWVKTIPGQNWFCYFRIYGPEQGLYDGTWALGDFELV